MKKIKFVDFSKSDIDSTIEVLPLWKKLKIIKSNIVYVMLSLHYLLKLSILSLKVILCTKNKYHKNI